MIWPVPGRTEISAGFNQPRPLHSENPSHLHGSVDIPGLIGDRIIAPETGKVMVMFNHRDSKHGINALWPDDRMNKYPFRNYFTDVFGPIIILESVTGMTHVFAHTYMEQNHDNIYRDFKWEYTEQKADDVHFFFSFYTEKRWVEAGSLIGYMGNSGHTEGVHLHYEIHSGTDWQRWEKRVNPELISWEDRF